MIRRPKIGMKVRILGARKMTSYIGGNKENPVYSFDADKCETGVIIDIQRSTPRAHNQKFYTIEFNPPNFGKWRALGTSQIEEVTEKMKKYLLRLLIMAVLVIVTYVIFFVLWYYGLVGCPAR